MNWVERRKEDVRAWIKEEQRRYLARLADSFPHWGLALHEPGQEIGMIGPGAAGGRMKKEEV